MSVPSRVRSAWEAVPSLKEADDESELEETDDDVAGEHVALMEASRSLSLSRVDARALALEDAATAAAVPRPARSSRHRLFTGLGTLAVCAVVAVALWASSARCPRESDQLDDEALLSLAEARQPQDLVELAELGGDRDALRDWLAASTEASEVAGGQPQGHDARGDAEQILQKAMAVKDPEEAKRLVRRGMGRAVAKWRSKRHGLKRYLKSQHRGLRYNPFEKTPQGQADTAECVFNVLQATDQVAALASNINDAQRTCSEPDPDSTSGKICAVNIAAIFNSVATIAGALSLAADNCVATITPNVNALCAGAVTGIVAQLAQLSGSAALVSTACDPEGIAEIPPGTVPSHLGTTWEFDRRLDQGNASTARRLMFGGGVGSETTQCIVSATSVAWWLAQAGLAINAAANPQAAASCHFRPEHEERPHAHKYKQALCAVDVSGAIYAFGEAVQYIQLAVAQCSDELKLQAMCGAGIDGIVSSFAGMASSGSALYIACNKYQTEEAKAGMSAAAMAGRMTAGHDPVDALGNAGNFGRRLSPEAMEERVATLRQRFSSPAEAWKSIGYDLSDPGAEFRKAQRQRPAVKDIVELVEQPTSTRASGGSGLLGGWPVCA